MVSCITIRLLTILSITMGLITQQVDYTNSFCQAPLDQVVYVEIPRGFEQKHMVLELQQSVYGRRQSPLKFYRHLIKGLESSRFTKSIMMTVCSIMEKLLFYFELMFAYFIQRIWIRFSM